MLTAAAGALVFGLWPPFAPPAAPDKVEVAAASQVGQGFGGRLELVAYRWQPATATGNRPLVLYWRGVQPIADDLRTSLRVLDGKNELIWEWKRSPAAGRFSTDHWPAGRVVADAYSVPAEVLARAAHIEVGLRPFPEGPWLPIDGAGGGAFLSIPLAAAAVPVAAGADWPADDAGGRFRGFSRLPGLSAKPPESAMPWATSAWQVGRS